MRYIQLFVILFALFFWFDYSGTIQPLSSLEQQLYGVQQQQQPLR